MKPLKLIFSGGGTGGHIFPAIAIANEVKKRMPETEILFVGALGRMEMEKVPAAGYPIEGIPIAGLQRKLSLANLKLPFLVLKSLLHSRRILKRFRPDAVIGTGGYASGPLLRAAAFMNVPILIQEQNSYAGITNRLLSRKAEVICVAYEGMEKYFPKEKIRLTGNPVRKEVIQISGKREEALKFFGLVADKPIVLVVGGSLGARAINESMGNELDKFVSAGVQVIWQCGKVYYAKALEQNKTYSEQGIRLHEFIVRMDLAYACADLVISRAGAGAISELCLVEKACILVPLPTAAENHQYKNAMALVNKGAAVLVSDADCKLKLRATALDLVNDAERRKQLQHKIAALAQANAAENITDELLRISSHVSA